MEWLNINVNTVRTDAYTSASNNERAVWFSLLIYCAAMENGGRIENCRDWNDLKWAITAGVRKRDVLACEKLVTFDGNNLTVMFYPHEQHKSLLAKRAGGKKGNAVRWGATQASESLTVSHSDTPTDSDSESGKEGKGREGKGIPPNPQGGLSEGELKFVDLKAVLVESGKVPETITERDLAVAWRNVVSGKEPNADPRERGLLDHIRAALNLHAGRIGSPAQWIAARAAEFQEQKKQAGRPISNMGPGA